MTTITMPADDLPELNCKPHGDSPADFLAQFEWFEISPVRHDGDCCTVCDPAEREFFTIYGYDKHGEALAVHDAQASAEIARVRDAIRRATGKPFRWFDPVNGPLSFFSYDGAAADFEAIANWRQAA